MNSTDQKEAAHKTLALWITVIIEGLMLIAVGLYNIYEIRRNSELVQSKIEGLAHYSARQGEKIDRMLTGLEAYVGYKFSTNAPAGTNDSALNQRIGRAIEFLERSKRDGKVPAGVTTNDAAGSP